MHDLALLFSALADPTRQRLLHLIKDGEICVCFLQGVLQTNQPKISRHLAYLRKAGLVEARRNGKWIYYRLKAQPAEVQSILAQALRCIAKDAAIRRDEKRLGEIQCCPGRYGFTTPD